MKTSAGAGATHSSGSSTKLTYTAVMSDIITNMKAKKITRLEGPSLDWVLSTSKPFLELRINDNRLDGIMNFLSRLKQHHQIKDSLKWEFSSVAADLRGIEEVAPRIYAQMTEHPTLPENLVQKYNSLKKNSKNNQGSTSEIVLSALYELITEHFKHHYAIINKLAIVLENEKKFEYHLSHIVPEQRSDLINPKQFAIQMNAYTTDVLYALQKADEGFQEYNQKLDSFVNSFMEYSV